MNSIECLIVSSTLDYSTDYICYELKQRGCKYLRINRDEFIKYSICYSLDSENLIVETFEGTNIVNYNTLKSIYFRAPVFLRSFKSYTVEEQLHRSQWNSFIRNLIVFDKAKWINHPVSTYQAENKAFQLKMARQAGFLTPCSFIGNDIRLVPELAKNCIIKSLDTALFYDHGKEYFTYSTCMSSDDLLGISIIEAPIIIQEYLTGKTDVRVTYVDGKCFPISITIDKQGIIGDWRKNKKELLEYNKDSLPTTEINKINSLMNSLGLSFGGIDLAKVDDYYYFIEVNPTGEWGWIEKNTDYSIAKEIVNALQ